MRYQRRARLSRPSRVMSPVGAAEGGAPASSLAEAITNESPAIYTSLDGPLPDAIINEGSLGTAIAGHGVLGWDSIAGPEPIPGSYVSFSGSDALSVASDPSIDLSDDITVMAAFRPDSLPANNTLFSKGSNSDRELFFYQSSTTQFKSNIYQDLSTAAYSSAEGTHGLTSGSWNLVLLTIATGSGAAELYFNSATPISTTLGTVTGTRTNGGTDRFRIGAWEPSPSTYYMRGSAGHWAIFDSKLSAAAISRIFAAGIAEGWTP